MPDEFWLAPPRGSETPSGESPAASGGPTDLAISEELREVVRPAGILEHLDALMAIAEANDGIPPPERTATSLR